MEDIIFQHGLHIVKSWLDKCRFSFFQLELGIHEHKSLFQTLGEKTKNLEYILLILLQVVVVSVINLISNKYKEDII